LQRDCEKDDLKHFVLHCPELDGESRYVQKLLQPYEEEMTDIVGKFLFGEDNVERKMKNLLSMYKKRTSNVCSGE